jgi:hypothetical protein
MKLIGQEEIWENLKKANAVARALAWYEKTKGDLLGFVKEFPKQFIATLKSFKAEDLLDLPAAFGRVAATFGDFAGRFIRWAGGAIWNLLEIIFDVVSPGALGYVKKTGAAFKNILKNPIGFVGNLVKAAKLGLSNFAANIGEHLKAGLIDWLTGSLPGVYIPKALSLGELGKFALSVLGITWAQIRAKIVKALGPTGETIMKGLETTFDVVVALVKGGPAAAWELIKEKLTNLKDMVIEGITSFVVESIVKKAIPKLISMFIPGAGFISAILSIYDTIMVFVEKLAKIAAAVKAFVDSIVAITQGQIAGAAQKVENTLAGLLSLAISFLAGFLGLGNVAEKILGVIKKVAALVDKALEAAVAWIVGKAKGLFGKLFGKGDTQSNLRAALTETHQYIISPNASPKSVESILPQIKDKYGLKAIDLVHDKRGVYHVKATINPTLEGPPGVLFTPEELAELDNLAKGYAKQINDQEKKKPGSKAKFLSSAPADQRAYLKGAVTTGPVVEAAGAPSLAEIVAEANLKMIRNAYIQYVDAHGAVIGGKGPELDFLIIGNAGVQEIVSAKMKPKQFYPQQDRRLLGHFAAMPLTPPAIVQYVKTIGGINKDFDYIASANVVSSVGKMPLGEFRSRYLTGVLVNTIVITPLTPGPERPGGLQLRVTEAELLDKVIELIKKIYLNGFDNERTNKR